MLRFQVIFAHPSDNHDNAQAAADRSSDSQPGGGAGVDDVDLWLGATTITTPAFVYEQTMARELVWVRNEIPGTTSTNSSSSARQMPT